MLVAAAAIVAVVLVREAPQLLRLPGANALYVRVKGAATVEDRLAEYGPSARARLGPAFEAAGVPYPPERVVLVVLKRERQLEIHAPDATGAMRHVKTCPILAASGKLGPKLREGDRQVPEGFYGITFLNPNSAYHLSLRVGYPNAFDREQGTREGRTQLGGDIMIHGNSVSIGCVAIGDEAIEEVFVLAADVGISRVSCIFSPVDFRVDPSPPGLGDQPAWVQELHGRIRDALGELPSRAAPAGPS